MLKRGMSMREVAPHLSWSRSTVGHNARAAPWQDMMKDRLSQASKLDVAIRSILRNALVRVGGGRRRR
ncbi:hypothetical protein ACH4E7_40290 [Kitasatospora sp. NPDC018058]|uniref:hypothetical protein n=1 Tax=Kitasatospora sp. NPDC018058 TaxID=3364025 RepID=UPI0037C082BE